MADTRARSPKAPLDRAPRETRPVEGVPPKRQTQQHTHDQPSPFAASILRLHRDVGNAAVVQMLRDNHGPAAVIRRLYAPTLITLAARQPAADYLWNNATQLVGAYMEAIDPKSRRDKADLERVLLRACDEIATLAHLPPRFTPLIANMATAVFDPASTVKATLTGPANPVDQQKVLAVGVRALNTLERDQTVMAATNPSDSPKAIVKVGTEFTFTGPSVKDIKTPDNVGAGKTVIDDWKQKIEMWTDPEVTTVTKPTIEPVDGKVGKAAAWKFTYQQGKLSWWWVLDVDDECVETQTAPTPRDRLLSGWVSGIMTTHIFNIATGKMSLGVNSSEFGGGGHISLDSETLFGGSVDLLIEVLKALQDDCEKWKTHFNYTDEPNSPWLSEQGFKGDEATKGAALVAFKDKMTAIETLLNKGSIVQFDSLTEDLKTFHEDIVNLWATANERNSEKKFRDAASNILTPKNRPHYQAVNVEHLVPEKGEGRRLELRSIGAQPNVAGLEKDLDYIMALIQRTRDAARSNAVDRGAMRGVWG